MNPPLVRSELGWPIVIPARDPGEHVAGVAEASSAEHIVEPFSPAWFTERMRCACVSGQPALVPGALAIDHESRIRVADPTATPWHSDGKVPGLRAPAGSRETCSVA